MLKLSKDVANFIYYLICISVLTLKEASLNGTHDFKRAGSEFVFDGSVQISTSL